MKRIVQVTLGLGILVLAGLVVFKIAWPRFLLKEQVTIVVGMWEDKCVLHEPPETITTQWDRPVTWKIAGNCPNHKVRVDGFVSIDDGTAWDPTERRTEQVNAEHGQRIEARVKSKDPARKGKQKYAYLILIDGQVGGDTLMQICPDWPC